MRPEEQRHKLGLGLLTGLAQGYWKGRRHNFDKPGPLRSSEAVSGIGLSARPGKIPAIKGVQIGMDLTRKP